VRDKVASRDWESLVSTVRNGPPKLSPMRIPALDRLTNTLEFFVHLEDVRRAQPGWSPRNLPTDLEATLLDALRRGGRLIARRAPCGLTATPSGHGTFTLRKGSPTVDIAGDIGEIVLYLYGRSAHARVELTGPAESVAAVSATRFGV
jgi:uncharacterized protein (TIGR03085 family)